MRFAPDLEASRTRERARARLVDLSAPGGMVSSNRWWIDGEGWTCCELHEGEL